MRNPRIFLFCPRNEDQGVLEMMTKECGEKSLLGLDSISGFYKVKVWYSILIFKKVPSQTSAVCERLFEKLRWASLFFIGTKTDLPGSMLSLIHQMWKIKPKKTLMVIKPGLLLQGKRVRRHPLSQQHQITLQVTRFSLLPFHLHIIQLKMEVRRR